MIDPIPSDWDTEAQIINLTDKVNELVEAINTLTQQPKDER